MHAITFLDRHLLQSLSAARSASDVFTLDLSSVRQNVVTPSRERGLSGRPKIECLSRKH